jgi:hypothetical protein
VIWLPATWLKVLLSWEVPVMMIVPIRTCSAGHQHRGQGVIENPPQLGGHGGLVEQ